MPIECNGIAVLAAAGEKGNVLAIVLAPVRAQRLLEFRISHQ
jgi:hypothetical protein